MTSTQDQRLLRRLAWNGGLLVVLVGCVWTPILWLKHWKDLADELRATIQTKQHELHQGLTIDQASEQALWFEEQLEGWKEVATEESFRVSELAVAAEKAGVIIVSITHVPQPEAEQDGVLTVSNEVEAVGDHRELAAFLDEIQSTAGLPAVESVRIEAEEDAAALRATIQVAWHSSRPPEEAATS